MTDRIKGLVITLDQDYREDDVEDIIDAIKMIRGVAAVDKSITTLDDHINRQCVRQELVQKLFAALKD